MLLKINNVDKGYGNGRFHKKDMVLKNVSLTLDKGKTVGIMGGSGKGKTTLGLLMAGVIRPDKGKILLNGQDIWAGSRKERDKKKAQIQMVFQHPDAAFNPRWTLEQSLREPCHIYKIPLSPQDITKKMAMVGLGIKLLKRYPSQLSGGELQRIALARLLTISPSVIVLDEPTSMLDVITQAKIIRLLMEIQENTGISFVFITHDGALARVMCHEIHDIGDLSCSSDRVINPEHGIFIPEPLPCIKYHETR